MREIFKKQSEKAYIYFLVSFIFPFSHILSKWTLFSQEYWLIYQLWCLYFYVYMSVFYVYMIILKPPNFNLIWVKFRIMYVIVQIVQHIKLLLTREELWFGLVLTALVFNECAEQGQFTWWKAERASPDRNTLHKAVLQNCNYLRMRFKTFLKTPLNLYLRSM